MGLIKNLFKVAAVAGAAVGGAKYLKKRQEERSSENAFAEFDDFDDEKIFNINKDADDSQKVNITINTRKIKDSADKVADKILDTKDKAMDTVSEKIGEEHMEQAKEKINDFTEKAKEVTATAKDFAVDKIGEENINTIKEKVSELTSSAKDKIVNAAENAKDKAADAASTAKEKVADAASTAKEKVADAASTAKEKVSDAMDKMKYGEDVTENDFVDESSAPDEPADTNATQDDVVFDDELADEVEDL